MNNKATNAGNMKQYNRQLILRLISREPLSRAEIARQTGLTRAAVTIIADSLITDGLVAETGTGEADHGRKPVLLDIKPDAFFALGLDISRGGSTVGIVNLKGEVGCKKTVNIAGTKSAAGTLKRIAKEMQAIISERKLPSEKLLGLGVSAPGPIDIFSGTILNPPNFEMWHNVNIIDFFEKELGIKTYLENHSAALTLAEKNFGAGRQVHNFMLLVVDTGIGAGIVLQNALYRGGGGYGSEVGHTTVQMDGKLCSCGNRGCLEVYAAIPAVLREAEKRGNTFSSWEELVDRAVTGDAVYGEILENEARYLSAGIANVMNILELEAVVLTGDITYRPETLVDKIRKYVESRRITRSVHDIQIFCSRVAVDADMIAAATIVIDWFFNGK